MFGLIGMTGDDIYRNFTDGDGPNGLFAGAAILNDIAKTYDTRATDIQSLVGRMESAWEGDAAAAAQRGAGPVAVEHQLSGMALGTAQDLTNRQAGSFSEAKGRVVPVPPTPEPINPTTVFTDPTVLIDHEQRVDEHSAAAQNNVDVMNGYSSASDYNTTNLPASYGALSDDNAGIVIGSDHTATGAAGSVFETSSDSGGDSARGAGGEGSSRVDERPQGDRTPTPGPGGTLQPGPGNGSSGSGSAGNTPPPGITTPDSFVPNPSGQPVLPTGPGAGRVPVGATGGPPFGGGPGVVGGPNLFGRPHGGVPGGGAPGGGGAGPRAGGIPGGGGAPGGPGGRVVGAEPHGPVGRPGPTAGTVGGRGGGAGMGGMPMGAGGRGGDSEDAEHKRPEWLEGGDPDELFGTDVFTAPQVIGEDD
ncbi:hypothetical protein [Actinophytocola sediminis]